MKVSAASLCSLQLFLFTVGRAVTDAAENVCSPSPCGINAECNTTGNGNIICSCPRGSIGDPFKKCYPTSGTDEAADLCNPSPCGINADCNTNGKGNVICSCLPSHSGDPLKECYRIPVPCSPLTHVSRDVECNVDGKNVDCSQNMAPGTRAHIKCNSHYTQVRDIAKYTTECKQNGHWSRPLIPCEPKCGMRNATSTPLISNGRTATQSVFPWHAGIYKYENGKLIRLCGGSIISPQAIVTAAHCFWDDNDNRKPTDFKEYRVVVGSMYREWNTGSQTNYTQIREINNVAIHERYTGTVSSFAHDIAVVVMMSEIQMTETVKPICIDYERRFNNSLKPGVSGVVVGWNYTENNSQSEILHSQILPLVSFDDCENAFPDSFHLTGDKFCAGYLNGTNVCRGDGGGGYVTNFTENRWYLAGIASIGVPPQNSSCSVKYAAFTNVADYYDFIKEFAYESYSAANVEEDAGDPCKPSPCGPNAQCGAVHDRAVCSCLPKYIGSPPACRPECVIHSDCAPDEACINQNCADPCVCTCGTNAYCVVDKHVPICSCLPGFTGDPFSTCSPIETGMCPPLTDPSRDFDCIFNGQETNCNSEMVPGTKASVRCKHYYEQIPPLVAYDMTCKKSGKWNKVIQPCAPKCGQHNPQGKTLIGDGEVTKIAEYPWHVGLYRATHGEYEQQCGGTLVSSRVIVTAAHCFPEVATEILNQEIGQYKVVAGKYYRGWNNVTKYTQRLEIERIVPHRQYRGASRNHENDIAVIMLKYEILINEVVRPVCVDFDRSSYKYFSPGIVGKVIGWGLTEKQEYSDVLLTGSLTYVNPTECEEMSPSSFHDFLLFDKFCAGKGKSVVCKGDSGGGYVVQFRGSQRWFLVGVVSIGPPGNCSEYPYAALTNVYSHLDFIRQYVNE